MAAQTKWTPEQREAVTDALDAGLTSRVVAAKAGAGELELNGVPLPAFEVLPEAARGIASRVRRLRPPADRGRRLVALNERMLKWAEGEMRVLEKAGPGKGDARRFQQLATGVGRLQENERTIVGSAPRTPAQEPVMTASSDGGSLLQAMRATSERPILPMSRAPLASVPEPAPELPVSREQIRREMFGTPDDGEYGSGEVA